MTGYLASLRLVLVLLRARILPRLVVVMTLGLVVVAVAFAGVKQDEGFRALASGSSVLAVTVAIFGAVLGGVAISGDLASGALRAVLLRPVTRPAWFLAHATALALFTVLLYVAGAALLASLAGWRFGFADIRLQDYVITEQSAMRSHAIRLLLLPIPALACAPLLGLVVSTLVDDLATAVVASLAIVGGPLLVTTTIAELPAWVFAERLLHPVTVLGALAQGDNTRESQILGGNYLLQSIGLPLLTLALTLALGAAVLRARDVKA